MADKKMPAQATGNVSVKLIRSLNGRSVNQKATAESLGLTKINDVSVQPNNAATQGKIKKISHLVAVTEA